MKGIYCLICSVLLLMALSRCTDNTLFDDEIGEADQRTVSGTVYCDDDSEPSDIVVWAQEFNLTVRTDRSGHFLLRFPPPELQPGAGYSGSVNLYFYMANYKIERASALMKDGKVQYGQADITARGNLAQTVLLRKLIQITTTVSPSSIPADFSEWFQITTSLYAANDTVEVETFKYQRDETQFTNVFFRHPGDANDSALYRRQSTFLRVSKIRGRTQWYCPVHSDSIRLLPGVYEVIPYVLILQDEIPERLMGSFGIVPYIYDNNYLNIPFKQTYGHLTVTDSSGGKYIPDRLY